MRSSRSLTLGLETFGGLGAWRSVTLTGESSCDRTPGLDGVILIKAGRDRDEAVSVRAMLPRDLVGPIPQCAARINASAVSLRRSKLPIDDDPSARNLFLADSDRPHRECPVSRQVMSCFCRLLITVHTFTTAVTRSSISSSGRMSMRFGVLEHRVQFLQLDPGVLRRETPAHLRLRLVPSLLP